SITGYRAAVCLLNQEADLNADYDYQIVYSMGQARSISGVVNGQFDVAAVSHDKLLAMIAAGRIKEGDYRTIYESRVIPRLTVGYSHRLAPKLAAAIVKMTTHFENVLNDSSEDLLDLHMRFFPVNYALDFEFVRSMDNSFEPRFSQLFAASRSR